MNIEAKIWEEAKKRGLDWRATGGGFDYIHRILRGKHHQCQLTLSSMTGESPEKLDEECEVGVALHTSGYVSIAIPFKNVIDALDFMQKVSDTGIYFMPDQYESGQKSKEGFQD